MSSRRRGTRCAVAFVSENMALSSIILLLTVIYFPPKGESYETTRHLSQLLEKAMHVDALAKSQKELCSQADVRRNSPLIDLDQ